MKIRELLEGSAADSFRSALQGKPSSQGKGVLSTIKKGVKTGYTDTQKTIRDLPYTKVGRAARGALNYFQKVNKGPPIK